MTAGDHRLRFATATPALPPARSPEERGAEGYGVAACVAPSVPRASAASLPTARAIQGRLAAAMTLRAARGQRGVLHPVFRSPAAMPLMVTTITSRYRSASGPSGSGSARSRRSISTWR